MKLIDFVKREFIFIKEEMIEDLIFAFIVTMFITLLMAFVFKTSIIIWFIDIIFAFFLLVLIVLLASLWISYKDYRKWKK